MKSKARTAFKAFVGGFTGASYGVRRTRGRLVYERYDYGYKLAETMEIRPSPEDWERFWSAAEGLGVWVWLSRYEEFATDGTSWSVSIRYGGRAVDSSGSNAFPDGFDRFCQAVSRLVGGRRFQ